MAVRYTMAKPGSRLSWERAARGTQGKQGTETLCGRWPRSHHEWRLWTPLPPTPHKPQHKKRLHVAEGILCTHDDGEYCMVWSTSTTTKTALAALTRWEIAKHEMEREAFLHYDLAKPRPEPEINVNFQGQEL
ncbi:hypothetical protein E4U09_002580 [Claviceps aff. purpurea]|uniref:Uncharacterized protein n=1 Tax=Claviceps aff. purpurea TaxID=1967640 RepID=A0A9P7U5T0_9HYPO|nr:hypothetical protein E4U09_002580 [Claviceps aff. purpurea]